MQHAFGTVIWVVCGVSAVVAILLAVCARKTWDDYGRRGMVMDRDPARGAPPGSAAALAQRDAEIRDLLAARNARRARRGQASLDIDQELARLTAPAVDPELREEIRQLVLARNHRRVRAGEEPLDVEAEIAREIRKLAAL